MADDFFFGIEMNMDATGFIKETAEAQDAFEELLATMIHSNRQADATVKALAQSLSASPAEVRKALNRIGREEQAEKRKLDKEAAEANKRRVAANKEIVSQIDKILGDGEKKEDGRRRANLTAQRQHALEERRIMNGRRDSVASLRDTFLSLAAVAAGGATIAGIAKTVTSIAQEGADIARAAERVGVDPREMYKQREAAQLGGASREEGQQLVEKVRQEQIDVLQNGRLPGPLLTYFRSLGMVDPEHASYNKLWADWRKVESLRGNNTTASRASELITRTGISGNMANYIANGDLYDRSQKQADKLSNSRDFEADKRLDESVRKLDAQWHRLQYVGSHAIQPLVEQLANVVSQLADFATRHPDQVKKIAEFAAGIVGLVGAFTALNLVMGPLRLLLGTLNLLSPQLAIVVASLELIREMYNGVKGSTLLPAADPDKALKNVKHPERVQETIDFYKSKGYTQEQAIGMTASLVKESGLDEHAEGDPDENGVKQAYGIGQWHKDRQAIFKQVFGHDIRSSTLQEQREFYDYELHHNEIKAGNELRKAKTLREATIAAVNSERPAHHDQEVSDRFAIAQRINSNILRKEAPSAYQDGVWGKTKHWLKFQNPFAAENFKRDDPTENVVKHMKQLQGSMSSIMAAGGRPDLTAQALSQASPVTNHDNRSEFHVHTMNVRASNPQQLQKSLLDLKGNPLAIDANRGMQ